MAVLLSINGNSTSGGFLLAPVGDTNFPVPLTLQTDDGSTVNIELQFSSNGANASLSNTVLQIGSTETTLQIHSGSVSATRGDTVLQVLVDGVLVPALTFSLTGISNPQVRFRGIFQSRFATSGDYYNHPTGTNAGIMYVLPGEPNFVPATGSVPLTDDQFVGRVIRFNNPEVSRPHARTVGVSVSSVRATIAGVLEEFEYGDPIIGMPVNLGSGSYFGGNTPTNSPPDPLPFETFGDAVEPIANFEFHIGNVFSGRSATLSDRPIAPGAPPLTGAEIADYGIIPLATFNSNRITALSSDPDFGTATVAGNNLNVRIARIGSDFQFGYSRKGILIGQINSDLNFNPSESNVIHYLANYTAFTFNCKFFNFHGDEMNGQIDGHVVANTSAGITPLQKGIYTIQSSSTATFNALTVSQMTLATIGGIIGAGTTEQVVVTVSPDYTRLVISKAVITNPGDPPASWVITSRGDTVVGEFLSNASIFPRDLYYRIVPPNDPTSLLGNCEGSHFSPAHQLGYARLFADGATWKLLLHSGTQGAAGVTYQGAWAGSTASTPTGCIPLDVELLTPNINFGNVEEGMSMYREIVLLNRSPVNVTISLPTMPLPFGAPGSSTQVIIPSGDTGTLLVSFLAGTPGAVGPTPITLTANPVVAATLIVNLSATSVSVVPVDTILVLDRSGSMSGPALAGAGARFISKAQLRNEAAQVFIDLLRPTDRIGIVRFNNDAQQHMLLEIAGPELGGTGRINAAAALLSSDLNPSGSTSVGDGLFQANSMLGGVGGSPEKALVVLTDGLENNSLFISDVTLSAGVSAYAIGLGLPQNINVQKLNAVTGNTGGYLLVTGALDAENEFRLHKYFAQILSGIAASSIVVDPPGFISAGQTQRIPFYISEADANFDVILLTRFPMLTFWLEAADGTIINPTTVSSFNGQYVIGKASRYYRMRLPIFTADLSKSLGKWHIVIDYPGERRYYKDNHSFFNEDNRNDNRSASTIDTRRAYTVLVKARSSVQLEARIEQNLPQSSSVGTLVAYMKAFGLPLNTGATLYAQISRPDGIISTLPMQLTGNGKYEVDLNDQKMLGLYNITVKAAGQTPGNWALQREQSITAAVVNPVDENNVDNKIPEIQKALDTLSIDLKELNKTLTGILGKDTSIVSSLPNWLLVFLIFILIILLLIFWVLAK